MKSQLKKILFILGLVVSSATLAADVMSIAPIAKDPGLHGALGRAGAAAGWKVSWEIPQDVGLTMQTYKGEFPAVLKMAADEQLAKRGKYHTLACESEKTLRVVANSVTACDQPSPPIFQLAAKRKGEKRTLVIRYFRDEIEEGLTVGGQPWVAKNDRVEIKIERVQ